MFQNTVFHMKRASNSPAHPLHNQLDANSSLVFYMCLLLCILPG
jgi:hypothetical protein